jgi:hypothetical protein
VAKDLPNGVRNYSQDYELSPTSRNPFMACNPPIAPKSMPYWNGLMETRVHARIHFQFSSNPVVTSVMMGEVVCMVKVKRVSFGPKTEWKSPFQDGKKMNQK